MHAQIRSSRGISAVYQQPTLPFIPAYTLWQLNQNRLRHPVISNPCSYSRTLSAALALLHVSTHGISCANTKLLHSVTNLATQLFLAFLHSKCSHPSCSFQSSLTNKKKQHPLSVHSLGIKI